MTRLLDDTVRVAATPGAIRALLHDSEALRRVLPGCESLEADGPGAYRAVLALRVGFMTLRADATTEIDDPGPGHPIRLDISGRPRGLVGSFSVRIPFELDADGDGTTVRYAIDLVVSGRLAAFGAPLLRDTARRQVGELVANVERELRE